MIFGKQVNILLAIRIDKISRSQKHMRTPFGQRGRKSAGPQIPLLDPVEGPSGEGSCYVNRSAM